MEPLRLSPGIIQALEILWEPLVALEERIEEEMSRNENLVRVSGSGRAGASTPELRVERTGSGREVVTLCEESVPRLRVARGPSSSTRGRSGATAGDLETRLESARGLIEAIERRYETMRQVAQAVIDRQGEFLEKGMGHLRPLDMQTVAEDLGIHQGTVAHAVESKWIETPQGTFPLRRLFDREG